MREQHLDFLPTATLPSSPSRQRWSRRAVGPRRLSWHSIWQPKERKMEYFAGLDVSLETVNVFIVNAAGDILLEKKIAAEPAAIIHLLKSFGSPFKRIGLEVGPTSSWLYGELRAAGYGAVCLECRHVKAGLSAMRNKTTAMTRAASRNSFASVGFGKSMLR